MKYKPSAVVVYLVALTALTTGPSTALAQPCSLPQGFDKAWVGGDAANRTNWFNPANWNPSGVPTASDSVYICAAAVDQPVAASGTAVFDLWVDNGARLELRSGTLVVAGNLWADGAIDGPGVVESTGDGYWIGGTLPGLRVRGTAWFWGDSTVRSNLVVTGSRAYLYPNDKTVTVLGGFTVESNGVLAMVSGNDTVIVKGNANFLSQIGGLNLTAGRLTLEGDLNVAIGGDAFVPSGSHLTVLRGSNQNLDTVPHASGPIRFSGLELGDGARIGLQAPVVVENWFTAVARPPAGIFGNGQTLSVVDVDVVGLVLDNVLFRVNNGYFWEFNSVIFQNYPPAGVPFVINHPGARNAFVLDEVQFLTTPTTGKYLSVTDTSADADVLSIQLLNPTPCDGTAFTALAGGATVEWACVRDVALSTYTWPDVVTVGGDVIYYLYVDNYGPSTASGVVVTNRLPVGAAFVSADSTQGVCTYSNGVVRCALGTVPAYSNAAITIIVTAMGTGRLTNSAIVTLNETDSDLSNNSASDVSYAVQNIFSVLDTIDSGAGSLRQAILDANAAPGLDAIVFDLPLPGPFTISLSTPLPAVSDPVALDGTSQPGYFGSPIIELDGFSAGATANGLTITAGNSVVRGLVINGFGGNGLEIATRGGNIIEGNYIGTDVTGEFIYGNIGSGVMLRSAGNRIGGARPGQGNVLSGNDGDGITFTGPAATGNVIEANYVGLNWDGSQPLKNFGNGILISGGAHSNQIGGITRNAGNYISYNDRSGIAILDSNGTRLWGNVIGLDLYGSVLGNGEEGMVLSNAHWQVIGGTNTLTQNVIAGNGGNGLLFLNSSSNVVQGNVIGTDPYDSPALANGGNGIGLISTNALGTVNNLIGGTAPRAGNVISGNSGNGIELSGTGARNNRIEGNFIGSDSSGDGPLPNLDNGVWFAGGASSNIVGGVTARAGNVIAYNDGNGVAVAVNSTGDALLGNAIFENGALGIDLQAPGESDQVTYNDLGDADSGPNRLQNFPVIISVLAYTNETVVVTTLNSTPNSTFRIEFFSSYDYDYSDYGEGQFYLGSVTVTTDNRGYGVFTYRYPTDLQDYFVTATSTSANNDTSEFSEAVAGLDAYALPPIITGQPQSQAVPLGTNVTLRVVAIGSPPLFYQWQVNGGYLERGTNATLVLTNFQFADAGDYNVAVYNDSGYEESDIATVVPIVFPLPFADNFGARGVISGFSGAGAGNNSTATAETGEPFHADTLGGKSLWLRWTAPATGVARFRTIGSSFDTVLAIYTGSTVANLVPVAGNDDDPDAFLTSKVEFNAFAGTTYQIAVDGYEADFGQIVLSWDLDVSGGTLPEILGQPRDRLAALGGNVVFSVLATGNNLAYQWFFEGAPIAGATSASLVLNNVGFDNAGLYLVQVASGNRQVYSDYVFLEIQTRDDGTLGEDLSASDKFGDVYRGAGGRVQLSGVTRRGPVKHVAPVRGYSGTQIFSTYGSGKEEDEPNHCGLVGGASQWFAYQAQAGGTLVITTDGSDFDTLLAVYTGPGDSFATLVPVECDNNGGLDGRDSRVALAATAGTVYWIAVDGVDGDTGSVQLNWNLLGPPIIGSVVRTNNVIGFRLTGQTNRTYVVEGSTNLVNWVPLLTTNSVTGVVDFRDAAPGFLRRFYRAVVQP